jgi:hypothetical protein
MSTVQDVVAPILEPLVQAVEAPVQALLNPAEELVNSTLGILGLGSQPQQESLVPQEVTEAIQDHPAVRVARDLGKSKHPKNRALDLSKLAELLLTAFGV